jgi:predicted transposase YdaD
MGSTVEIQAMLHWPEIDIKQTRVYQDAFTEGRQVRHQEGQEDGRQRKAALLYCACCTAVSAHWGLLRKGASRRSP